MTVKKTKKNAVKRSENSGKSKNNQKKSFFNLFNFLLLIIFAVGIFLRAKCYIANPSLWHDECALAWNIKTKSYFELFGELRFLQVAPPLFLISIKALFDACKVGTNVAFADMIMVAIPFISSIFSIFVFYFITKEIFEKKITKLFANAFFAINFALINYSYQLKQYSTDVLVVLLVTLAFLKLNPEKLSKKSTIFFALLTFLSIWFSFISVFFILGGLLILFAKRKGLNNVSTIAIVFLISCFLYAKIYVFSTFSHNSTGMIGYWGQDFINKDFSNFLALLLENTKYFFAPIKFDIYMLCIIATGFVSSLFLKRKDFTAYLTLALLTLCISSIFKIYPFLGRVILFLAPFFIIYFVFPLEFVQKDRKIVSTLLIGLIGIVFVLNGFFMTKFALLKTYTKSEIPRELMQIINKNIKSTDKIFITQSSNCEYFYYSSFFKRKNQLEYKQYENDFVKYLAELKKLKGHYWIYLPYDTSIQDQTTYKIVQWTKTHAKVLKYVQNGQSVLIYANL